MTRSELIKKMISQNSQLLAKDVELAVKILIHTCSQALAQGDRIEIRGFGSFALKVLDSRKAHNPKTGEELQIDSRGVARFKPAKELKIRINH